MPDLSQAKLRQVVTMGGLGYPMRYRDGFVKMRSDRNVKPLLFAGIGLSIMVWNEYAGLGETPLEIVR